MSSTHGGYYVPQPSHWPVIGSIGLLLTTGGFAMALPTKAGDPMGSLTIMFVGFAILAFMLFGWFGTVIKESEGGLYNAQVDRSFRMGMSWFIFSEVMFFAAFFGALYYIRIFSDPWLGGAGNNLSTHEWLYPQYTSTWPTNGPGNLGGDFRPMEAWGIPAINTLILLSSGVTVTWAHWGLKKNNRAQLIMGLMATVVLGFVFVGLQAYEYMEAYHEYGLKLTTGAYGSTFFMLTGFHGLHVSIGAIMLLVVMLRSMKGHFSEENHFAFEAAAWYWHFVDVVWLGLFIFVYWLI